MTNPLMQYLPPVQQQRQPQAPATGASKYHGAIATGYDAKRENDPKWICEQRIIEGMLADLPKDATVLDCPVGTGRFMPFYLSKGFKVIGMDLSRDMLLQTITKLAPNEAQRWVDACNQARQVVPVTIDDRIDLGIGDVRNTGHPDKSVDATVNCRITRWLSPEDCQKMLREMQRVARKRVIWTARVANHPHARSRALFEAALQDGWRIVRDEAGYEMDYRILEARPT